MPLSQEIASQIMSPSASSHYSAYTINIEHSYKYQSPANTLWRASGQKEIGTPHLGIQLEPRSLGMAVQSSPYEKLGHTQQWPRWQCLWVKVGEGIGGWWWWVGVHLGDWGPLSGALQPGVPVLRKLLTYTTRMHLYRAAS